MLRKEFFRTRDDGINLYRTYSDEDYYIVQLETGNIYEEAIDIENSDYTYDETDNKIHNEEEEEIIDEEEIQEIME